MAKLVLVTPDGLSVMAVSRDGSIVRDNIDVGGFGFTEEVVENAPQDWLKTGGDYVERDAIIDAEPVEGLEIGVDVQRRLHDFEAGLEWNIEGTPHLLGHLPERALAAVDLCIEYRAPFVAAAEVVKEDVAGILHEDRAVEV